MRTWMTRYWVGILILVVSMVMMTGCCMRLQSPVVFDTCCNWGYYDGYWGGGSSCCNPCPPAPCNPCQ